MNSQKNLETILAGFRPLRPSDKVRDALFGQAEPLPALAAACLDAPPPVRLMQVWFAPMAAAAVLVLSLAPVLLPSGSPAITHLAFAALDGAWQPNAIPVEHNIPPTPTFHSTIGAAVAPSFGSLLLRQTNILVR